jgi:hypothetical protein
MLTVNLQASVASARIARINKILLFMGTLLLGRYTGEESLGCIRNTPLLEEAPFGDDKGGGVRVNAGVTPPSALSA